MPLSDRRTLPPASLEAHTGAPIKLPTSRATQVLAILANQPGQLLERETLAHRVWPEKSVSQARHSLRQALLAIRKTLGEDSVLVEGASRVGLRVGSVKVRDQERPNPGEALLSAVEWCVEFNPRQAQDLLASAFNVAIMGGKRRCRQLTARAIDQCKPSAAQARALYLLGCCDHGEDYLRAIETHQRCMRMSAMLGEQATWTRSVSSLIFLYFESGDHAKSISLAAQAESSLPKGDRIGQALISHAKGMALAHLGELATGRALVQTALQEHELADMPLDHLHSGINLGWIDAQLPAGDPQSAVPPLITIAESAGEVRQILLLSYIEAHGAMKNQQWDDALVLLRRFWSLTNRFEEASAIPQALESAAEIAVHQGNLPRAAELLVRAHTHRQFRHRRYSATERRRLAPTIRAAREHMTDDQSTLWKEDQMRAESGNLALAVCPF